VNVEQIRAGLRRVDTRAATMDAVRSIVHPEDIAESIMSLAVNGESIEMSFAK